MLAGIVLMILFWVLVTSETLGKLTVPTILAFITLLTWSVDVIDVDTIWRTLPWTTCIGLCPTAVRFACNRFFKFVPNSHNSSLVTNGIVGKAFYFYFVGNITGWF